MNNLQKRKLKNRLMVTLISILSCIAVMAVGVYAASSSYAFQVSNVVDIELRSVNGTLYGKRYGDVILGEKSMGEEGFSSLGTTKEEMDGTIADFIVLYGNEDLTGFKENAENMAKIETPVNFYTQEKDTLSIYYVFKFEFEASSPIGVNIAMTNTTTQLTDERKNEVTQNYKYYFGATEPIDWSTAGTSFGIDEAGTASIQVKPDDVATHVVYIYASLTVTRTDSLATAYTLGMGDEEYHWRFGLNLTTIE